MTSESSGLTPSQGRLLWLMATGLTHRQAASQMGNQPQTVKNELREIRRRLGAPNTLAAVLLAWRRGWLELPEQSEIVSTDGYL